MLILIKINKINSKIQQNVFFADRFNRGAYKQFRKDI